MNRSAMLMLTTLTALGCAHARPDYPPSRRQEIAEDLHGQRVADPYRWLEDASSPEVQAWMKAQDELTRATLARIPGRDAIAARLKELFYLDTLGVPATRGSHLFYSRHHATQEKAVVYWRESESGPEKVLLDPNAWSADGSVSLGGWNPSWDGKRVVYGVRHNNADEMTLHLLDVDTMQESKVDAIEGIKFGFPSWNATSDGFWYTRLPVDSSIPPSERSGYAEIRFHRLGQPPASDLLVREKTGDPHTLQSAYASKDGHWLVLYLSHGSASSNDVWLRDLRKGEGAPFVPVVVGRQFQYGVHLFKDRLYVSTDEGAPRGRIFVADADAPAREGWKELVPQHPTDILEGMSLVGGRMSLHWLHDVVSRLEVRELDGSLVREIALPGRGRASALHGEADEDAAYWSFTSFLQPYELHRTSVQSGADSLYFRLEVPVDPSKFEAKQLFFSSRDGTRVPLWILHRKGLPLDGSAPALLTGYGGFRHALEPAFAATAFAWMEHGGVWALANLRGGNEYGEEWHKAGMLAAKQNVFDDFIGAAEYLVRERYTSPARLAIMGGSNGGLLVGAAETQRPELFGTVLCSVPLLDMVRFPKFGVAKFWVSEYGDPDQPEHLRTLLGYSPYHRLHEGVRYPATLLLSADSDDRVDPMHARKFAAALQHASSGGPVFLRVERHAGHGGADLIKASVEKTADELAFALWQAGLAR